MALESCVFLLRAGHRTDQNTRASLVTMLNVPNDLQCVCPSLYKTWSTLAVCLGGTYCKAAAVIHLIFVSYLLSLLARI